MGFEVVLLVLGLVAVVSGVVMHGKTDKKPSKSWMLLPSEGIILAGAISSTVGTWLLMATM